jgi:hypothetical protein
LRQAEDYVGPLLPSELFSVQALLEKTEHAPGDRDFQMWTGMRRIILGQRPPDDRSAPSQSADQVAPTVPEVVFVSPGEAAPIDPDDATRRMLAYAWRTAPSMARVIATMQREAEAYVPTEQEPIASAISSRKRSAKAEYLRAFDRLLRDKHQIDSTAGIINAMAITATVVLHDPDDAVTAGDVRSAVTRLVG